MKCYVLEFEKRQLITQATFHQQRLKVSINYFKIKQAEFLSYVIVIEIQKGLNAPTALEPLAKCGQVLPALP